MASRRTFFKNAALITAAGTLQSILNTKAFADSPQSAKMAEGNTAPNESATKLPIGIAGYTFNKLKMEEAISIMKGLSIPYLSLKDFYLPFDSSPEKTKEVLAQFSQAGVQIYAVGVIYMKSEAEVDRAFKYAAQTRVDLIVAAPNYDLLAYTEKKVKETGIRIAIHNHGPEDKLYPSPADAFGRIKNMDPKMGLCIDIGHSMRAGTEPSDAFSKYHERVFDLHIKDVTAPKADAKAIEMGRGCINFPALVKALEKYNYQGKCSIEYEKDMEAPLSGIAESTGFFRGVLKSV